MRVIFGFEAAPPVRRPEGRLSNRYRMNSITPYRWVDLNVVWATRIRWTIGRDESKTTRIVYYPV